MREQEQDIYSQSFLGCITAYRIRNYAFYAQKYEQYINVTRTYTYASCSRIGRPISRAFKLQRTSMQCVRSAQLPTSQRLGAIRFYRLMYILISATVRNTPKPKHVLMNISRFLCTVSACSCDRVHVQSKPVRRGVAAAIGITTC